MSISCGEAVRLCHLNERKSVYKKRIINVKDKRLCSNFKLSYVKNIYNMEIRMEKICWKLQNIRKIVSSQNHSITRKTE